MTIEYRFTVRGYEQDVFGHVNNAVYLNYIEQARWEILRDFDLFDYLAENQLFLAVIETNFRYIRETKVFDELVVTSKLRHNSPYLLFEHSIYNVNTQRKVSRAKVKTLLVDHNRVAYDLPQKSLEKVIQK